MKKIYTLSIVLSFVFTLNIKAQDFEWAKKAGGWAYDYGYGVCTDAAGNIYVAGKYEDGFTIEGNEVYCAGNHDMFLAKYNSSGSLQWFRRGGGLNGDYAHGLTCDANGNVYVAGEIDDDGYFLTNATDSVLVDANPSPDDAFVAKYDTDGNLLWVKAYGGYAREEARAIAIDVSGNSYIIGKFNGPMTLGTTTITGDTDGDAFIAKLDPSGNPLWAKRIGGPNEDSGRGIAVDVAGNVYAVGGFQGTADIGGMSATSVGYRDVYLGKWATDGTPVWVKIPGGSLDDVAWGISLDASGNPYITGEFNGDAWFDAIKIYNSKMGEVFIAKYNPAGNAQWATAFGDTLMDVARAITTDGTNVFVTGNYGGSITVGSTTVNAADSTDIFVASFSAVTGTGNWIIGNKSVADAYEDLGTEGGNAINVSANGLYVTGSYITGDTLGSTFLAGGGAGNITRTDMFLAKVDPLLAGTGIKENQYASAMISVYPNPSNGQITVNLKDLKDKNYTLRVINTIGREISVEKLYNNSGKISKQISLNDKGLYFLELSSEKGKAVQKVVIY